MWRPPHTFFRAPRASPPAPQRWPGGRDVRQRDVHRSWRRGSHGPAHTGGRLRPDRPRRARGRLPPGRGAQPQARRENRRPAPRRARRAPNPARARRAVSRAHRRRRQRKRHLGLRGARGKHGLCATAGAHRRGGVDAIAHLTATAIVLETRSERWPRHQAARNAVNSSTWVRRISTGSVCVKQ